VVSKWFEMECCFKKPIKKSGISLVINLAEECETRPIEGVSFLAFTLKDTPSENIYQHFDRTLGCLQEAKEREKRTLVHCQAGVSRSATIVIAYLMKNNGWSLEKARNFVRERRGIIEPNHGFLTQLKQYQGYLNITEL